MLIFHKKKDFKVRDATFWSGLQKWRIRNSKKLPKKWNSLDWKVFSETWFSSLACIVFKS